MKKILLVEDDLELVRALEIKITESGYTLKLATDGDSALETLKTFTPDLILLDIIIPKKSGIDVLKFLKSSSKTKSIPVIVLTNLVADELIKEALDLGANDYITKSSVNINDLINKIDQCFL